MGYLIWTKSAEVFPTVVKIIKGPRFSGTTFVIENGFSHGCHDGIFPHLSKI